MYVIIKYLIVFVNSTINKTKCYIDLELLLVGFSYTVLDEELVENRWERLERMVGPVVGRVLHDGGEQLLAPGAGQRVGPGAGDVHRARQSQHKGAVQLLALGRH